MNLRQKLTTALMTAVACFLLLPTAAADQVINDDLIVTQSICVGTDCVNGESFGFDTLRLKENNLRIKFQDTSNSGSFPTQDWQITANDSANGGANKFSIDAIAPATGTPFTIEAGAPSHSLYVDDGGRIGLGTSTPVTEIHIKDGDSPTLRLEQDGSSGFTAQTWDVAGNEANFFVRDATNGSKIPFKIIPNSPANSLVIEATTGDVGMGVGTNPAAPLHIRRTNSTAQILVEDTGATVHDAMFLDTNGAQTRFTMQNSSDESWTFQTQGGAGAGAFSVTKNGSGATEFMLTQGVAGNLTIAGGLITSGGGGACTPADPCDGVFEPSFEVESIEEHAEFMWENNHLKAIGPTLEQGPIDITKKTGGLINELEKAHIYIERLNERLKEKESKVDELTDRLARLESLLTTELVQRNND